MALKSYMERRYVGQNVLLGVTGNVDPQEISSLAERLLGDLRSASEDPSLARPVSTSTNSYLAKDVEQVHFCMSFRGFGMTDPKRYTLSLLSMILGGGFSSRLYSFIL